MEMRVQFRMVGSWQLDIPTADCMEVTLIISILKCLETHVADIILPSQDYSLKWQTTLLEQPLNYLLKA